MENNTNFNKLQFIQPCFGDLLVEEFGWTGYIENEDDKGNRVTKSIPEGKPIPPEAYARWDAFVEKKRQEFEDASYFRKRVTEYPRITDQLDMLFKDIDAGKLGETAKTGEWYKKIKQVKDANPKP